MDIKILDSWLREYLESSVSPTDFAKFMSLSGPTVDRTHDFSENDKLYEIEVTSNRVDAMSIYGIAREASAILPRYEIEAKLKELKLYEGDFPETGEELILEPDPELTYRLMGVVLTDIDNWQTPDWMTDRLKSAGMRSINSVVDITNYVMHEVGHPCHVFDYDAILNSSGDKKARIVARLSKEGEKITSFDGKEYTLSGGDIVFDDGSGNIIDLPGIIGTKNTTVNDQTKRILFFLDTNSAKHIRKTSMELAIRTNAAVLNEKGVDPELAKIALLRGILLFKDVCGANISSPIYDEYPVRPIENQIEINKNFINKILDINIDDSEITNILNSLGFEVEIDEDKFFVKVPTFRSLDVTNKESVVEEIARVYGYQNLPSKIMSTGLPTVLPDKVFSQENKLKNTLVKLGGVEVYTFSLVSEDMTSDERLRILNPLGSDTEYLRTSLLPSLVTAMNENKIQDRLHLFELSGVYQKSNSGLPNQFIKLGGIFKNYEYREAKGIIEKLLSSLNIIYKVDLFDSDEYIDGSSIIFSNDQNQIMKMGLINSDYIYYEADFETIRSLMRDYPTFEPIPEFPPQIEDITVEIKEKSVGEIYDYLKTADIHISKVELIDIFEKNYTFRIFYQAEDRTMTDKEVEKIRNNIISKL